MFKHLALVTILSIFLALPASAQGLGCFMNGLTGGSGFNGCNATPPSVNYGCGLGPCGAAKFGPSQGSGAPNPGGTWQNSAGSPGALMRWSDTTAAQALQGQTPNNQTAAAGSTYNTAKQAIDSLGTNNNACSINGPNLPPTMTTQYGTAPGIITPLNQLPATVMDSFVINSGYSECIYGDEGCIMGAQPPINTYTEQNTIGAGIYSQYLSTGHASTLPSAWLTGCTSCSGGLLGGCLGSTLGNMAGGLLGGAINNAMSGCGFSIPGL